MAIIGTRLRAAVDALEDAARFVVDAIRRRIHAPFSPARCPFLELAGIVCGGAELGRAALVAAKKLAAGEGDADFLRAKIATSRHFADHSLTKASGLRDTVVAGAGSVLALPEAQF